MTTSSPHVWDPESLARTSGSCLGNRAPLPHFPTNQTSSALPPLCDGQPNGWMGHHGDPAPLQLPAFRATCIERKGTQGSAGQGDRCLRPSLWKSKNIMVLPKVSLGVLWGSLDGLAWVPAPSPYQAGAEFKS